MDIFGGFQFQKFLPDSHLRKLSKEIPEKHQTRMKVLMGDFSFPLFTFPYFLHGIQVYKKKKFLMKYPPLKT